MHELGIEREADRRHRQRQAAQQDGRPPDRLKGEEHTGQGGERAKRDESLQDRQRRVDVGIDRAEDDAAARVKQFVGVKLVAPGFHADQHGRQEAQVEARLPLHMHGARPNHDPVRQEIEGSCSDGGKQHKADQPFLEVGQERQREDVEPQVLAEERVGLAEGNGLAEQEVLLPVGRAREGGDQGQDASHAADGEAKAAPERLGKAKQHEGVHGAPVTGRLVPPG